VARCSWPWTRCGQLGAAGVWPVVVDLSGVWMGMVGQFCIHLYTLKCIIEVKSCLKELKTIIMQKKTFRSMVYAYSRWLNLKFQNLRNSHIFAHLPKVHMGSGHCKKIPKIIRHKDNCSHKIDTTKKWCSGKMFSLFLLVSGTNLQWKIIDIVSFYFPPFLTL
jgi:hypothetical protein